MADYIWEIEHGCPDEDLLRDLLNDADFRKSTEDDYLYKKRILDWKTLKIYIKDDQRLKIVGHWLGGKTTEKYFDYLMNCGIHIGRLISNIEYALEENPSLIKTPEGWHKKELPLKESLSDGSFEPEDDEDAPEEEDDE
jgi:hypothetical protein